MMLTGNLFFLNACTHIGEAIRAAVTMDPSHPVFAGHFPGTPVVPGVCMMQLVKEIFEQSTGKKIVISTAASLKFLRVVNPLIDPALTAQINYRLFAPREYEINAELAISGAVCFKMKASFKEL